MALALCGSLLGENQVNLAHVFSIADDQKGLRFSLIYFFKK